MNKQNIIEKYNISDAKFIEILDGLNISQDTTLFSDEQISLFERVLHLARQQKKSYKQAIAIVKNQSAGCMDAMDMDLDPQLTVLIDQQLAAISQRFAGEAPYMIKQQQEQVRRYIVRKYWEKLNGLVASGEMQRAFERVLGTDSLEAQILPGESPVLPESSSSDS